MMHMNDKVRHDNVKYLWSRERIDEIVSYLKGEDARKRLKFVLLRFSNPYTRNKKQILKKYIIAFPDHRLILGQGKIVKLSKSAPEGNIRNALYVVLINIFSTSGIGLYNFVRNMLIDKKVIKAEKHSVQTYGGRGINTSCNAPSYSKRSFFVGLTGGRGAVIRSKPSLR